MSPIPGTLQIPLSGRSSTLLLVTASRTVGVALADSAASAESADLARSVLFADCAAWAEVAARAEVAEVAEAAAGAEGALVAADAGRAMNSPPSTTVIIAAASSRARADRRAGRDRPARGRGSAIS